MNELLSVAQATREAYPGRLVLVWNGHVYQVFGNDAAVASRLAPSTRLHARGRGCQLQGVVWYIRPLLRQARKQGIALALAHPEWCSKYGLPRELFEMPGRTHRMQMAALAAREANTILIPPRGQETGE